MPNEEGGPSNSGMPDLEIEAATFHSPQLAIPPGQPSGHQGPVLPHLAHESFSPVEILIPSGAASISDLYKNSMSPGMSGSPSNGSHHLATNPYGFAPFAAHDGQDQEDPRTQGSETDQESDSETLYHSRGSPDSLVTTGQQPTPNLVSLETLGLPHVSLSSTIHDPPEPATDQALLAYLAAQATGKLADDAELFSFLNIDDDDLTLDQPSQYSLYTENSGDSALNPMPAVETPGASGSSLAFDAQGFPDFAATQAAWQAQSGGPGNYSGLPEDDEYESADINNDLAAVEAMERNLNFCKFIREWRCRYQAGEAGFPHISTRAMLLSPRRNIPMTLRGDLGGEFTDIQGIDWHCLETTRRAARGVRSALYRNYTNCEKAVGSQWGKSIPNSENYYQFRSFDLTQHPRLYHFQLRHNVSASSSHDVFYAGSSRVLAAGSFGPSEGKGRCVMDLSQPEDDSIFPGDGMKVCTLSATNGVLIAGGYHGEYAMKNLSSEFSSGHIEGIVTNHENGITNHVHTVISRSNSHPHAIFASNDCHIRTLDCYTNTLVKEQVYPWAVNCTATSPDGRLRVVVGDTQSVMIDDAERGRRLVKLGGHQDFGFSCAWADDGRTVATANQDMQVMIYDARWWQRPLTAIWAEQAGARSLHFSPVGSGKRVLLMAEPADIVSVVDAVSFESKQTLEMFGEISGTSFSPDGSKFFVANTDAHVGGIAEYERIGCGEEYGIRHLHQQEIEDRAIEYVPEKEHDWVPDHELLYDTRVIQSMTTRRRRGLGLDELTL
ncbi:MAG: hypothetical protein M1836_004094 [Candelina mexicana]|nr:MAG: hypothetical protein M1836_004094 [Candelina mexicana]